jgi:hypothetical protein
MVRPRGQTHATNTEDCLKMERTVLGKVLLPRFEAVRTMRWTVQRVSTKRSHRVPESDIRNRSAILRKLERSLPEADDVERKISWEGLE